MAKAIRWRRIFLYVKFFGSAFRDERSVFCHGDAPINPKARGHLTRPPIPKNNDRTEPGRSRFRSSSASREETSQTEIASLWTG